MDKELYLSLFEKYVANRATTQEVQELVSFLKNSSEVSHWFEQQVRNSPPEVEDSAKQRMFNRICEQIDTAEKPAAANIVPLRRWLRAAAIILLPVALACGGYLFYAAHDGNAGKPLLIVVERGEKANVTLPDGSRVWLNSASKLTYHNTYNEKNRLLQLNGEAYFEVVPDAEKKFIVQCADMEVEVSGTTFNIKAYDEDSTVSAVLIEGKVRLTAPNQTWDMKPNERIVLNKLSHKILSTTVNPTDFTEWRKNRLRFENEPILDLVKTVARMHNVDCVFADESIKSLRFSGSVDNTSIESILNTITLTAPISYTVKDSLIIIYKDNRRKEFFN
jgi:ferric-dicitrate binding protein FerR (iron transport regulator)